MVRILSIEYTLKFDETYSIKECAAPLEKSTRDFEIDLRYCQDQRAHILRLIFNIEIAEPSEAKALVEPFLEDWIAWTDVSRRPGIIKFEYLKCGVQQDLGGSASIFIEPVAASPVLQPFTAVEVAANYPELPPKITTREEDVDFMLEQWNRVWSDKSNLVPRGYAFYSVLTKRFNNAARTAEVLWVDLKVLNTFLMLTSERGGKDARKHTGKSKPLSSQEEEWLRQAMAQLLRRFIQRIGRRGKKFPQLTMSDLPVL